MGQSIGKQNSFRSDVNTAGALEVIKAATLKLIEIGKDDGEVKELAEQIGNALVAIAGKPPAKEPERESLIDTTTKLN